MADEYDQPIKKPNFGINNEELLEKRYSAIVENQTVQRRGSEHQYMGRRNKALRAMRKQNNTEQDATILAAMHAEHMAADNWSQGVQHSVRTTASYIPAKEVAMTIQAHQHHQQQNIKPSPTPPPPPGVSQHKRAETQPPTSNNNNTLSSQQQQYGHKGSASSGVSVGTSELASSSGGQMNGIIEEENVLKSNNSRNRHEVGSTSASEIATMNDNNSKSKSKSPIGRNETLETYDSQITRSATNSKYNDEDIYSEMEFEKFKPNICIHLIVFVLVTVLCGGVFYYFYLYEWPKKIYYNMSYAAILWFLCILFLCLNMINKFHKFHEFFGKLFCHRGGIVFIGLTIIFGLIEYILWSLENEKLLLTESSLGNDNFEISLIIIDIIWYLTFFFLFAASMSNWPTISYYFSESLWLQALLYMSVFGYLFIWICRKLRKPDEKNDIIAWYKKHDKYLMIREIMKVTSWLFLIFIILAGIMTPIFGEGVRYVSELGTIYAIGGYIILSFMVMLTPLMPGSIIDVAGGFLFVYVLVSNHNFHISLAWIIGVFSIILLHYCGACAQWYIGSMRVVQFYLNRTLPPELLAASDSVLETAHCGLVGLIGYVFLDTANGLNQGRINMKFWTQLCSEWSSIPNAFAVVSLGATIALPAIYPEEWESISNGDDDDTDTDNNSTASRYILVLLDVLIPLLALIAALVQFSGVTLAARILGKSIDTDDYMMAREKWTAVQFFYNVSGYVPSTEGWKNDVLQLGGPNKNYPIEYQKCLFEDVMPLQKWYVQALHADRIKRQRKLNKQHKDRRSLTTSKLRLLVLEKYRTELESIRNLHYTTIEAQYDDLINNKQWLINPNQIKSKKGKTHAVDYLIDNDDDDDINRYFSEQNIQKFKFRKIFQVILLIIFVITFWISFYRIYWQADFFERVAIGVKIFNQTNEWYDWVAFTIFVIAWSIYNVYQIKKSIKNMGRNILFMLKCCRINRNIESRFKTPHFDTKRYDENGNLIIVNTRLDGNKSMSSLPEKFTNNLYVNGMDQKELVQEEQQNGSDVIKQEEDDDYDVQDVGF